MKKNTENNSSQMHRSEINGKLANPVNSIGDIKISDAKTKKIANKLSIPSRIIKRNSIGSVNCEALH